MLAESCLFPSVRKQVTDTMETSGRTHVHTRHTYARLHVCVRTHTWAQDPGLWETSLLLPPNACPYYCSFLKTQTYNKNVVNRYFSAIDTFQPLPRHQPRPSRPHLPRWGLGEGGLRGRRGPFMGRIWGWACPHRGSQDRRGLDDCPGGLTLPLGGTWSQGGTQAAQRHVEGGGLQTAPWSGALMEASEQTSAGLSEGLWLENCPPSPPLNSSSLGSSAFSPVSPVLWAPQKGRGIARPGLW